MSAYPHAEIEPYRIGAPDTLLVTILPDPLVLESVTVRPDGIITFQLIGEVLDVMKQIAFEGTTMVVVTHEMGFANDVADRILFVDKGLIVESGPPDQIFGHAQDERTKLFLEPIRKVQQI
jgi:ABC-type histidine transport system ATPase subunit